MVYPSNQKMSSSIYITIRINVLNLIMYNDLDVMHEKDKYLILDIELTVA